MQSGSGAWRQAIALVFRENCGCVVAREGCKLIAMLAFKDVYSAEIRCGGVAPGGG